MPTRRNFPALPERAFTLLLNTAVFYVVFIVATGRLLPTGGLGSVWLLSAFALWFFSLLSAPWFIPPRDALANAMASAAILITMNLSAVQQFARELNVLRWAAVVYCVTVAIVAIAALLMHDRNERAPAGRLLYRVTGAIGSGELVYTAPALIGIVGAYQRSFYEIAWLTILWVFFVLARPIERLFDFHRQWNADRLELKKAPTDGTIERVDDPDIIRVRLHPGAPWPQKTLHIAAMPDGTQRYLLALFTQVQGAAAIGTGIAVGLVTESVDLPVGEVCRSNDTDKLVRYLEDFGAADGSEFVGFVVEGSTIQAIRFEVSDASSLTEGDVVACMVRDSEIFYQILDAETSEESFDGNPQGKQIVRAAQLGCYSRDYGFTKYQWLPEMNTPIVSVRSREFPPPTIGDRDFTIGNVPSTDIDVVANLDDFVEYHAAILGVTGTGKTELALDIVREAVERGIKVFCVDFTGEYRQRLADLDPVFPSPTPEQASNLDERLFAVETGDYGGYKEKPVLKEAIDELREQTYAQVDGFLRDGERHLAVFELSEIANTKATLRLTELYLSSVMSWAREHRRARQVLLVLEEAHTIVPETYGAGFDRDTQWVVGRVGQIALQGRKYGVGLLVVTQRTALVSKTILSQCNTFLTHGLIDQTSLNFLESVYSGQHVRLIPNLEQREFLAFGKALRTERPILLRRPFDASKKAASDALRRPLEN